MPSLTGLLSHVPMYVGLQKAVGADTLRYRCLDAARLRPGEVVVDVGCGPAYYFERLPQPLTYHGFEALAAPHFASTATEIVSGTGRIHGAYVLMTSGIRESPPTRTEAQPTTRSSDIHAR